MNTVAVTLFVLLFSAALAYPSVWDATLTGNAVVPPSSYRGNGSFAIVLAEDQQSAVLDLTTTFTGTIQSILIRDGGIGNAGNQTFMNLTSSQPITGLAVSTTHTSFTFADFVNNLIGLKLHIEVKATEGSIRGAISLSSRFYTTVMSPNLTAPPNTAGGVAGKGDLLISQNRTYITISYQHNVSNPSRAIIAQGNVGSSGSPYFYMPVAGATDYRLDPTNGNSSNAFANLLSALQTGTNTYIEIGTGPGAGKLRGYFTQQTAPVFILPSLTPSPSATKSLTPSTSKTPSVSRSRTPSRSHSPSVSVTASPSVTRSISRSKTPSTSRTASATPSILLTQTASISRTKSVSKTKSISVTRSPSPTSTISVSPENSSVVPSNSGVQSFSAPVTPSPTSSFGSPPSVSATRSTDVNTSIDGADGADGDDGSGSAIQSWIAFFY